MSLNIKGDYLKHKITLLINEINMLHPLDKQKALNYLQKCIAQNITKTDKVFQNHESERITNDTIEISNKINKNLKNTIVETANSLNLTQRAGTKFDLTKNESSMFIKMKQNRSYRMHILNQKMKKITKLYSKGRTLGIWYTNYFSGTKIIRKRLSYLCEHCHNRFKSKIDAQNHKNGECSVLNEKYEDSEVFENNSDEVEESEYENGFKCQKCGRTFIRKQQYKIHIANHDKYKCRECSLTFTSQKQALKHRTTNKHEVDGLQDLEIQCLLCPRTFLRTNKLKEHMQAHAVNNLISCPICGISYQNKKSFDEHMQKSGHNKPVQQSGENHLESAIEDKNEKTKISTNEAANLVCDVCGKCFPKRANLVQHKKRIHTEVRFTCDICDFSSTSRYNLQRHITSHTSERQVVCEQCGTAFRNSAALKEHTLYMHQEECQHQCNECPKKFKVKNQLSRHMQSCHSTERRFACQWCTQAYKRSSHLRRHQMQRHPQLQNQNIICVPGSDTKIQNDINTEFVHKQFENEVYINMEWNENALKQQTMNSSEQESMLNMMNVNSVELVGVPKSNTMKQLVTEMNTEYMPTEEINYQTLWSEKQPVHTLNIDNANEIIKFVNQETLPKVYMDKFVTTIDLNNGQYLENDENHKLAQISSTFVENTNVNAIHSNMDQGLHQDLQQTFSNGESCNNVILMEHSTLQGLNDEICKNISSEHNDLSVLSSLSDYMQTPFQYV